MSIPLRLSTCPGPAPPSPSAPKPSRRRPLGIPTLPQAQAVFVATPGIHEPRNKLGEHLNATAREALEDPDLILAVFDLSQALTPQDRRTAEWRHSLPDPDPILSVL